MNQLNASGWAHARLIGSLHPVAYHAAPRLVSPVRPFLVFSAPETVSTLELSGPKLPIPNVQVDIHQSLVPARPSRSTWLNVSQVDEPSPVRSSGSQLSTRRAVIIRLVGTARLPTLPDRLAGNVGSCLPISWLAAGHLPDGATRSPLYARSQLVVSKIQQSTGLTRSLTAIP